MESRKTLIMEKVTLKKIPIETLLTMLTSLYENGVDFVDIKAEISEDPNKSDVIGIWVEPEYRVPIPPPPGLDEDGIVEEASEELSQEDIENLINLI
jgi:hypothetical protein